MLWFGAHRIDDGSLQIGALIAFLSYLMQILVAVMMVTFISVMMPRAAVCADRIAEVLDTESSVGRRRPRCSRLAAPAWSSSARVEFRYPGAEEPVLQDVSFPRRARQDHRDHRRHRRRQDHAARR